MNNEVEYVICPCCGYIAPRQKFCSECGSLLVDAEIASDAAVEKFQKMRQSGTQNYTMTSLNGVNTMNMGFVKNPFVPLNSEGLAEEGESLPEEEPADDSKLTMLVDFCRKTVATVGGDGYDETVLYRNDEDGTYQIHTYSKYVYMQKESHHSYKAKDGAEEAAFALIDKLGLLDYEGKQGLGLCGGMYVCKFQKDGCIHRVTTDNMDLDGPSMIIQVGQLIGSYIGEKITKEDI